MNHSRWHYIQGLSAGFLDKIGYYNLRTLWHNKVTRPFAKPDLQGWFSPANQAALLQTLEVHCRGIECPRVLEIGSWKGLSTSIIAEFLKRKHGQVYCVDSWQGNEGVGAIHKTAQYQDILAIFRRNMKILGVAQIVHPLVGKCTEVLPLLQNQSFDLIFIDADHRFTPFLYDLEAALRLVKDGGIICGDDCDEAYQETKEEFYQLNCEKDYSGNVHCGAVLGLHKTFGFEKVTLLPGSSFWVYRKEKKLT
jgi:SAM-dependent methyltransferase